MPRRQSRAAQDATLVNIRAAKKRIANLEDISAALVTALMLTRTAKFDRRFARRLLQLQIRLNK